MRSLIWELVNADLSAYVCVQSSFLEDTKGQVDDNNGGTTQTEIRKCMFQLLNLTLLMEMSSGSHALLSAGNDKLCQHGA